MTFFYDLNKRLSELAAPKSTQLNEGKGAKPDYIDLDKDGDKKEPMKKAAQDAKHKFKKTKPVNEDVGGIDQILARFPREVEQFKQGGELDADLEEALWDYHYSRGTIRNYNADASEYIAQDLADHLGLNEADVEEGNRFTGNLMKARAAGKKQADLDGDGDMEPVKEATKEIPGGRRHTSEPGGYGRKDDDEAPKVATKKGRGRPKKGSDSETGEVMRPDWSAFGVGGKVNLPKHKGAVTKHKMVGEDEHADVDAAIAMLKKAGYSVSKNKRELDEKAESENQAIAARIALQHKKAGTKPKAGTASAEMAKMSKADLQDFTKAKPGAPKKVKEEDTDTRDQHAEKAGRKVTKDIEYDERAKDSDHGKKRGPQDARAEKAGKRVAKDIEHDEKVDETTVSGSVAPAADAPKKSKGGMTFGKGIYDSWNRELEGMIAESINVSVNMSTNNETGTPSKNITVSADGEDADRLSELLMMAGLGNAQSAAEGSGCGSRKMEENAPDWPTNTEYSDDAFQYSGGLNKPKSTGQTTVPVIASQVDRQSTEEEIEETYDPYFDPESRESQKYKEPRDDIDPDSDDPYDDELDEIRLMKERAGISDGKYTQDYFTANKPSQERQRAEADREQRPNTPFSRDPIEATTDRAIDRLSQMFKYFKKK